MVLLLTDLFISIDCDSLASGFAAGSVLCMFNRTQPLRDLYNMNPECNSIDHDHVDDCINLFRPSEQAYRWTTAMTPFSRLLRPTSPSRDTPTRTLERFPSVRHRATLYI